jgi:mRNA interferase RelE/StbE
VTERDPYEIVFTSAARRRMNRLSLSAATAMFEHLTGPVADNPQRLGKQLDSPLDDLWSTRRGEYRAIYAIDDEQHVVSIVAVAHRKDAYRNP